METDLVTSKAPNTNTNTNKSGKNDNFANYYGQYAKAWARKYMNDQYGLPRVS